MTDFNKKPQDEVKTNDTPVVAKVTVEVAAPDAKVVNANSVVDEKKVDGSNASSK